MDYTYSCTCRNEDSICKLASCRGPQMGTFLGSYHSNDTNNWRSQLQQTASTRHTRYSRREPTNSPILRSSTTSECPHRSASGYPHRRKSRNSPRHRSGASRTAAAFIVPFLTTLVVPVSTAPANPKRSLHNRQAIPDQFGRTGNEPAPVKPDVSPLPPPFTVSSSIPKSSTSTETIIPTITSASSRVLSISTSIPTPSSSAEPSIPITLFTSSTAPLPTQTPTQSSSVEPPLETSSIPIPDPTSIQPSSPISSAAIAGIALGSIAFALLLFGLTFLYFCARRRNPSGITEIVPQRTSRFFNFNRRRSSSSSSYLRRTSSFTEEVSSFEWTSARKRWNIRRKGAKGGSGSSSERGLLRKSSISHPRMVPEVPEGIEWLEKPKPAFLAEDGVVDAGRGGVDGDDGRNRMWFGEFGGAGGEDRRRYPVRPVRSAEPLGRLSGMGLGMGLGEAK
ncbi:unnamed protein product [Periconia digitata]|uniref:Uncharacterized protein n=1 Tax=Periconia digitata TaxID=1303443 RepID=A0A9W4UBF2_9PLEO|nr:unnamed protein product [Periconia digitata]